MAQSESPGLSLRERVATHLEQHAEGLVDIWLAWLKQRLSVRQSRLLPTRELRDHMPQVIASIAEAFRLAQPTTQRVRQYLRLLTELRREQAYPAVEVLEELELFGQIVMEEVVGLIERDETASAGSAARVVDELNRHFYEVGRIAVETYQERAVEEKRRVSQRLAEFAGTIEHEIRNPLQAADFSANLLSQDGVATERRAQHAGIIRNQLQRISQLIHDLRELQVTEATQSRQYRKPLREVVQEVFEALRPCAKEAGVRLGIQEPLADIKVDASRIQVALMNLVGNAIKYADPDKPQRWVRISTHPAARDGEQVWALGIEDNGRGIPATFIREIFQRKIRAHVDVAEGTGMGLAIVKELMEQRGGAVAVSSTEGKGSRFTLELSPRIVELEKSLPAAE